MRITPNPILETFLHAETKDQIRVWKNTSREHRRVYDNYPNLIYGTFLKRYDVLYEDPKNFIYVANETNRNKYITGTEVTIDGTKIRHYNLKEIARLYNKFYKMTICRLYQADITSFPTYPNLIVLESRYSSLRNVSYQPNLRICTIKNSPLLISLPAFPELICGNFTDNSISLIGTYPKLKSLTLEQDNLETLPPQPNLRFCYIKENDNLQRIYLQPKLQVLELDDHQLDLVQSQPELLVINNMFPAKRQSKQSTVDTIIYPLPVLNINYSDMGNRPSTAFPKIQRYLNDEVKSLKDVVSSYDDLIYVSNYSFTDTLLVKNVEGDTIVTALFFSDDAGVQLELERLSEIASR